MKKLMIGAVIMMCSLAASAQKMPLRNSSVNIRMMKHSAR